MVNNFVNDAFLLETIALAKQQGIFNVFGDSKILYPIVDTSFDYSARVSEPDDSFSLDTLLQIEKSLKPVKKIQMFAINDMVITTKLLHKHPKSKKKRIFKKWLKKYGEIQVKPDPEFMSIELDRSTLFFGHPEIIKKLLADMNQAAKDTVALSVCEVFGIKF